MDKYEVIGPLGEGSFGRVYKAKQLSNSEVVALKVIGKRGRSAKEIKGLRRECEIQRHLDHPNIIKMLDSFETENEIVVITEFAQKELNAVLGKEGYLSEERVQTIVWDLVSALYYLHSHRVLHRDLKPQNILLDLQGKSKLCDFGFARNMSTGTHVLTSIKGTPLYMAPELIEEHPYDHTADLWSLGCITYELLVGAPPFCTTSILHLIRMIRHEEVQFPTFISDSCISFLKGLLQKDPGKRLTWPEILKHTFIKGHVFVLNDTPSKPLTRLLSMDTLHAKERQRKSLTQKVHSKLPTYKNNKIVVGKPRSISKKSFQSKNDNENLEEQVEGLSLEDGEAAGCDIPNSASASSKEFQSLVVEADAESSLEINDSPILLKVEDNLNLHEDSTPIENEEWVVFLQRSIEEILAGELTSVCQASLANISVTPLRKLNASPIVISYVAKLFSLPFVIDSVSDDTLEEIKQVYIDIKLIANLVYASKLLSRHKPNESDVSTPHSWVAEVDNLSSDDLAALESVYLLICHLVHLDVQFLSQFCDSVAVLGMDEIFRSLLLLSKIKLRIVTDLIAILTHVLQKFPENYELVKGIIVNENEASVNFVHLLKHSSCLLRERTCYFLQFLGRSSAGILESMWNDSVRDTLEALVYDSIETVRIAAESSVDELKILPFYNSIYNSNDFITT